jgi:hypothetical protein
MKDQVWSENSLSIYIKSCSREVAKHKSGVMLIPPDGTTFSHNIKEDGNAICTNVERPRWTTPYQKTSIYKSNVQVLKSQNIPVK